MNVVNPLKQRSLPSLLGIVLSIRFRLKIRRSIYDRTCNFDVEAVIKVYAESRYRQLALGVYFVEVLSSCLFMSVGDLFHLSTLRTDT